MKWKLMFKNDNPIWSVFLFFACVSLSLSLSSCSEDIEFTSQDSYSKSDTITVKLNLVGEVSVDEVLITRTGETSSTDLIGLQVYRNGNPYMHGLFDNLNGLLIDLVAGSKYSFECTKIVDGKNTYSSNYNVLNSVGSPFKGHTYGSFNKVDYTTSSKMGSLASNASQSDNFHTWSVYKFDRFYGRLSGYSPTVDGIVNLEMKRVSFGLKVKVSGLTDGSLSIKCYDDNSHVYYDNSNISHDFEGERKVFSLNNVSQAWEYANNDYQEAKKISVVWTRGIGIVQDLGTRTVYVKRNRINIIHIKLSNSDKDVDVDVDPEEGDMDGEDEDLGS